jgi:hypothetical protein
MLFKRKKILQYLDRLDRNEFSDFHYLLTDYCEKRIKSNLKKLGLTRVSMHIDWLDHIKVIAIQARYNKYFVEFQVDETEIAFAYDLDEADDDEFFEVKLRSSSSETYDFLQGLINRI